MRYIDADKIDYKVIVVGEGEFAGYRAVAYESDIDEMPTADVAPVVHAKWDENGRCTRCGSHAPYYGMASTYFCSPYCFSCGAKMDEKRKETK